MARCRNFQGSLVRVTGGAADVETAIAHELIGADGRGMIPQGYMVVRRNSAASLYIPTSVTPWTTENAYLASSVGGAQYYVIFFV